VPFCISSDTTCHRGLSFVHHVLIFDIRDVSHICARIHLWLIYAHTTHAVKEQCRRQIFFRELNPSKWVCDKLPKRYISTTKPKNAHQDHCAQFLSVVLGYFYPINVAAYTLIYALFVACCCGINFPSIIYPLLHSVSGMHPSGSYI
jgi:hypothetical protein